MPKDPRQLELADPSLSDQEQRQRRKKRFSQLLDIYDQKPMDTAQGGMGDGEGYDARVPQKEKRQPFYWARPDFKLPDINDPGNLSDQDKQILADKYYDEEQELLGRLGELDGYEPGSLHYYHFNPGEGIPPAQYDKDNKPLYRLEDLQKATKQQLNDFQSDSGRYELLKKYLTK